MNPIAPQIVPNINIDKTRTMMNTSNIIDYRNKLIKHMETVKIEIAQLKGFHSEAYAATRKQINLIGLLMARRGMAEEFEKYFIIADKVNCNNISKASASRLIDALKRGKKIHFIGHITIPKELPALKTSKLYKPNDSVSDVRRITKWEQEALEQKYIDEL